MNHLLPPSLRISIYFMWRDIRANQQKVYAYLLNYWIIYPILYSFLYRFLQPNLLFAHDPTYWGTVLYTGSILLVMLIVTGRIAVELLFDLESNRFIQYQLMFLSSYGIIIQRVLYNALFTFVMLAPFYPVSCLLLGHTDLLWSTRWPFVIITLLTGSTMMAAYHQLAILLLSSTEQLSSLWSRINGPLLALGGLQMPLAIIEQYHPLLGTIARLNPFIYVTEGLRQAIISGDQFLSLPTTIIYQIGFTIIFIIIAGWMLKRKTNSC